MLRSYVVILPNELFVSSVFRFYDKQKIPKYKFLKNLFGKTYFSGTFLWPTKLRSFENKIADFSYLTAEDIIEKNTLFPFYKEFLTHEKRSEVLQTMIYGEKSFQYFKRNDSHTYKYCPVCVAQDKSQFNDIYLHREHYLPGTITCSIHKCYLETTPLDLGAHTRRPLLSLKEAVTIFPKPSMCNDKTINNLADIAYQILNGKSTLNINATKEVASEKQIYTVYRDRVVIKKSFLKDFEAYSQSLDQRLILEYKDCLKFSAKIIKGIKIAEYPHLYILFDQFLKECGSYIQKQDEQNLLPCLNGLCENFEVPNLVPSGKARTTNPNDEGIAVSCKCGLEYIHYKCGKKDKILRHGTSLIESVKKMRSEGLSYEVISSRTRLKKNTLINLACKILSKANTSKNRRIYSPKLLMERRNIWLKALNSSDFINITISMKKFKTVYRWLANNDKEWLIKINIKFRAKSFTRKNFIQGTQADDYFYQKLVKLFDSLYSKNVKRQITKTLLREIPGLSTPLDNLLILPRCKSLLESKLESVIDYKIRKAKDFAIAIQKKKGKKSRSFVYSIARIKPHKFSEEQLLRFTSSLEAFGIWISN